MNRVIVRLQNRIAEYDSERGASMAEYGLLLAFIALAVITVITAFGARLNEFFGVARDTFANSPGGQLGGTTTGGTTTGGTTTGGTTTGG